MANSEFTLTANEEKLIRQLEGIQRQVNEIEEAYRKAAQASDEHGQKVAKAFVNQNTELETIKKTIEDKAKAEKKAADQESQISNEKLKSLRQEIAQRNKRKHLAQEELAQVQKQIALLRQLKAQQKGLNASDRRRLQSLSLRSHNLQQNIDIQTKSVKTLKRKEKRLGLVSKASTKTSKVMKVAGKVMGTAMAAALGPIGLIIKGLSLIATSAVAPIAIIRKLGGENERVAQNSEKLNKKWRELRDIWVKQLAPAADVIIKMTMQLVDNLIGASGNIEESFGAKLAANIQATGKVLGALGNNLIIRIKQLSNFNERLGNSFKYIASFSILNRKERQQRQEELRNESELLKAKSKEEAEGLIKLDGLYKTTYDNALTAIGKLQTDGYYNLNKITDEQRDKIRQLREEYEKAQKAWEDFSGAVAQETDSAQLDQMNELDKAARLYADALEEINKQRELANKLAMQAIALETDPEAQQAIRDELEQTMNQLGRQEDLVYYQTVGVVFDLKMNDIPTLKSADIGAIESLVDPLAENVQKSMQSLFDLANAEPQSGQFDGLKEGVVNTFSDIDDFLNSEEFQLGKQAFDQINQALLSNINTQIEGNERLLDDLRERREQLTEELELELELKEQGYASDVEAKRAQLEEVQRQEEEAQKKAQELQRKKAKVELAQNLASQISSLATAAANIFGEEAKKGLPGVLIAAGAIATMFAIFSSFKNKLKSEVTLYKGGAIEDSGFVNYRHGRSDRPGRGQGHRVEDSNLVLGGREFVVREEVSTDPATKDFLPVLNRYGLDSPITQSWLMKGGYDFHRDYVPLSAPPEMIVVNKGQGVDMSGVEKRLDRVERAILEMPRDIPIAENTTTVVTISNGNKKTMKIQK